MQLKPPKSIRGKLALATCSMLTGVPQGADAADADSPWEVDTAVLYYSEKDRVDVFEPVVRLRKEIDDDEFVSVRLVYDSLTGSSANGAIPTGQPQTFTTPSGASTYTTGPNETPLDPTFKDTRVAVSGEWETPLGERTRGIFSAHTSNEYDYTSMGAAAVLSRDYNMRNTTLTLGASYNSDEVDPVGGIPVGLTNMPQFPAVKATEGQSDDKTVSELLLGVTQVVSRRTLMQLNYSFGSDSGYLTDPYKLLSVVDGTSGELNSDLNNQYRYEKRPDARDRHAVFWKTVHQLKEDVIHVSYRYYWDDWDINSHTLDFRYRHELGSQHYLEPHLRYYTQTEAEFYRHSLIAGENVEYATADYRLGEMTTTTVGLKYGFPTGKNGEFGVRAEYMVQSGDSTPSDAIGVQRQQDLFPDVEAVIFQINYSLLF